MRTILIHPVRTNDFNKFTCGKFDSQHKSFPPSRFHSGVVRLKSNGTVIILISWYKAIAHEWDSLNVDELLCLKTTGFIQILWIVSLGQSLGTLMETLCLFPVKKFQSHPKITTRSNKTLIFRKYPTLSHPSFKQLCHQSTISSKSIFTLKVNISTIRYLFDDTAYSIFEHDTVNSGWLKHLPNLLFYIRNVPKIHVKKGVVQSILLFPADCGMAMILVPVFK